MVERQLSAAGYLEVEKTFKGKKPCTLCRITPVGLKAFEGYVDALRGYIELKSDNDK
ncbi:MAG: transcriptional regulator [Bacteroidales bacterium]|nr:transcriptional regulator [Bacteroidales bacterium]